MLDIIIKNGCIVDGTGKPSYKGSLAIKDGKVVKIQNNIDEQAIEIIDGTGLVVCPGFIDVHSIAKNLGIDAVDFALQLLMEEKFGVAIVTLDVFSLEDTLKLIKHPLQMVGSDSIPAGNPHPRLYGNYPLFIGKFVRDKKALSLEEALYKISYFPAKTLGLEDIGEIAVGKTADIVLFDLKEIKGFENYFKPTNCLLYTSPSPRD